MHVWVSIGMGIAAIIFSAGGAWAVVNYKLRQQAAKQAKLEATNLSLQKDLRDLAASIRDSVDDLRETIRTEVDRAISRINRLLFDQDDGTTRYMPRSECAKCHDECRLDLIRRIDKMEKKIEGGS